MSIAITEEHRALGSTTADLLAKRDARGAARELLETPGETMPSFWKDAVGLGWFGLHLSEEYGGSGYSLQELAVVVEELGRAIAPVPFVPTVIASALVAAVGDDVLKKRLLPGLADGSTTAGIALGGTVTTDGETVSGSAIVLGGGLATLIIVPVGDDVAVIEVGSDVTVDVPQNLDPTRRSARVTMNAAPATVLPDVAPLAGRSRTCDPVG